MAILNMNYSIRGGGGNIGEPLNLTVTTNGLDATIKWEDNEIGTIPPTTFQKSELVRKIGLAPTSPSDGDLVVTETVKDTYKVSGYVDQGLTDGETYYYRVFSYSDLGGISYCDAVSVTISDEERPDIDTYTSLYTKSMISSPHGIGVSADGTKLYIGPGGGAIKQYTMTDGLLEHISVVETSSASTNVRGIIYIKEDGTEAYRCSDNKVAYQATMPTPFSFTGSTIISKSISALGYYTNGTCLSNDGGYIYTADADNGKITRSILSTPRDLSTFTSTGKQEIDVSSEIGSGNLYGVQISPTGKKMFVGTWVGTIGIYQFSLSTPRDLSTASYDNKYLSVSNCACFCVTGDGKSIFHADKNSSVITQYTAS